MRIQARVFGPGFVAGALLCVAGALACVAPRAALAAEPALALSSRAVTTHSTFGFAAGAQRSREIALTVHVDPGDRSPRLFAHRFAFEKGEGMLGLRTGTALPDGTTGRIAIFSLRGAVAAHPGDAGSWAAASDAEGVAPELRVAYAWHSGRTYRLRVAELDADRWGAWVVDATSGAVTHLGSLEAPPGTGGIEGSSVASSEYVGPDFAQCSDLRLSRVSWAKPTANDGALASTSVDNGIGDGACVVARTSTGVGPTVHALGWSRVLYVGDSLAAETGKVLAAQLEATGRATVTASYFPGMALCDFLEFADAGAEPANRIRARVRSDEPQVVVVQFWGNASTPCIKPRGYASEAYFDQYRRDAFDAAQQVALGARDAGIPRPRIVWVLQGPEQHVPPLPPGAKSRPERLNEIYTLAARTHGDAVSDAGRLVSLAAAPDARPGDRYRWTQFLPCTARERETPGLCTRPGPGGGVAQLHKDDDPIHFCLGDLSQWFLFYSCGDTTSSPAIVRYGGKIAADVKAELGL
jgi:hypothetical protein